MSPTTLLRVATVAAVVLLAACTKPDAPDPERPPEPQAAEASLVPGMTVYQFMGYFLAVLALILAMRVLIFVFRK